LRDDKEVEEDLSSYRERQKLKIRKFRYIGKSSESYEAIARYYNRQNGSKCPKFMKILGRDNG